MKIAIIGSQKKNKNDQLKYSGYHYKKAFEQLGDSVDFFDWRDQNEIRNEYDFYFSVDSSESYEIRDDLHPLLVYNGDTHMPGGLQRDKIRCQNADIVFNGNVEYGRNLFMKGTGKKSYWLPLGFDFRFDSYEKDTKKDIDVSMVGHPNSPDRIALWDMLDANFVARTGDLTTKQYVDANFRAKIVVNQPTEPWDNIYNNRMIEGMACQCLVLQKALKTDIHKKIFKKDKDFVEWTDFIDLKQKIKYYLENEEERHEISTRAYEKVRKHYSYRDLCKIIKNYVWNLVL